MNSNLLLLNRINRLCLFPEIIIIIIINRNRNNGVITMAEIVITTVPITTAL